MGCCISKCRPQKQNPLQLQLQLQKHVHVQPKQVPPTPIPQYSISTSPPSPASSTSSLSSFTCTSSSNTITSSSSLSSTASSSALTSNYRSFSNDFLWACYQQNPHILRVHSLNQASLSRHSTNINNNPSPPPKPNLVVPQKRLRSSSPPNLTRQKSFRKEADRPNCNYSGLHNVPARTPRSPSPTPTFINAHKCGSGSGLGAPLADSNSSVSSRMIGPKVNAISPLIRRENVKAAAISPNNSSRGFRSGLRHRQSCSHRIGSKIDQTLVQEVVTPSNHALDSAFMEDIHNPLISLDCFIFL